MPHAIVKLPPTQINPRSDYSAYFGMEIRYVWIADNPGKMTAFVPASVSWALSVRPQLLANLLCHAVRVRCWRYPGLSAIVQEIC